jgi:hypothetical protein
MCGLTHELKHGVEPLLGDYVKSKFSFSDRILYSREGLCFRVRFIGHEPQCGPVFRICQIIVCLGLTSLVTQPQEVLP